MYSTHIPSLETLKQLLEKKLLEVPGEEPTVVSVLHCTTLGETQSHENNLVGGLVLDNSVTVIYQILTESDCYWMSLVTIGCQESSRVSIGCKLLSTSVFGCH